nr:retron Ec67 family RNA-directed DNA polymerase/endonuclease [Magnetofaba australis]
MSDLARLLGFRPKALSFLLYKLPDNSKYTTFKIPKKSGGEREINAPDPRLKGLQKRLANLLQNCFEEIYGRERYNHSLSHAFRKDHSIITNARAHKNKRYVFNIDLIDFFPSINFGRVRGYFIKNTDFGLHPNVATVIAQIVCYNNELPQGSPTSPVLSNLIGHILDVRLVILAKKTKCQYSRYADDITFSTREKQFPSTIATQDDAGCWHPSSKLLCIIRKSGFEVNHNKTTMQHHAYRQVTTGLVVNRKVNIKASYYRQARAMCSSLFKTGAFYIGTEVRKGRSASISGKDLGSINVLRGVLSHIYNVKRLNDKRDQKERWGKPTAIHKLYEKFVLFEKFHNLRKPLIFCEGKTDSVYLKCALYSLASEYPDLIQVSNGEVNYAIDFFKHSKSNQDLLQFSGGTGDSRYLIKDYNKKMKPFLCKGKRFPVIILVDSDQGSKKVFSAAKEVIGNNENVTGDEDFYYITQNLYLIALPKINNVSSVAIEDFFEKSVRETKIDGKSLAKSNESDNRKYYSKHIFAEKVIRPNKGKINFERFKGILDRILKVIQDYESRRETKS